MADLKKIFEGVGPDVGRYGVVGHNIPYTLSPAMHTAAMARFGIPAVYRTIDVSPDEWTDFVRQAGSLLSGFNVTVPHKERARSLAEGTSGAAWDFVGAVNTVRRSGDGWLVANTDVEGFYEDLRALGVSTGGKNVVLWGAGGAARAVLGALSLHPESAPARIDIFNRTEARVSSMLNDMAAHGAVGLRRLSIHAPPPGEAARAVSNADLLINATSAGGDPLIGSAPLKRPVVGYDLTYRKPTAFMEAVRRGGGTVHGGLGMLVNQGARAFEFWFEGYLKKKVDYSFLELRRAMRDAAEKALKERETA
ncbi:MAG: shikimate dehydrogenase [Elusimicrobia bacterium]|nr:shikimate dehydrogenase [Elusimicrobiota bacterium]